jgi:nucleoside phosphorylase
MILVTACFSMESRWVARRPGVRVVRTAIGNRSRETLDELGGETSELSLLIAGGFCGGIGLRIQRGDLFLAQSVRHRGEEIHIDPELLERARHALNGGSTELHIGPCESVDHVLRPDEKRALATDGVVAADMESGPLARWAANRGIPFIALRTVLDPVGMDLPFSTDRPFWTSALRHPIATVRVARGAIAAGRVLGTAIDALIDTFAGSPDA